MTRAILSCNGLDKPEGSVAREVAIRAAAATGGEIICPVLLNRAPARYKKALSESTVIVVDGCSTRCASKLADSLEIKVDRKVLVSDALKSSGMTLEPTLTLGPNGLGLAQAVVDGLLQSLNASSEPAPSAVSSVVFEPPTEYLIVTHDKFEFRIPAVDYLVQRERCMGARAGWSSADRHLRLHAAEFDGHQLLRRPQNRHIRRTIWRVGEPGVVQSRV